MSRARTCGERCHAAQGKRCKCWCGGVFHGTQGADARKLVREKLGMELTTEGEVMSRVLENKQVLKRLTAMAAKRRRQLPSTREVYTISPRQLRLDLWGGVK